MTDAENAAMMFDLERATTSFPIVIERGINQHGQWQYMVSRLVESSKARQDYCKCDQSLQKAISKYCEGIGV